MSQSEMSENDSGHASNTPPHALLEEQSAGSPEQNQKAPAYKKNANKFVHHFIRRLLVGIVRWLNEHDGVVTALATVVIAYLTWSLAEDSRRQAQTARDQFKIMKSQLDAMEAEQRPWVGPPKIEVRISGIPKTVKPVLFFENTGKTPAYGLYISAHWFDGTGYYSEANRHCEDGKAFIKKSAANTEIFAAHTIVPLSGGFPIGEIKDFIQVDFPMSKFLEKKSMKDKIVGCVIYGSAFDKILHSTSFIAPLDQTSDIPVFKVVYSNVAD